MDLREAGRRAVFNVSQNTISLDEVARRAVDREIQKDAENKLQKAKDILAMISIDQVRGMATEEVLVEQIYRLLTQKLMPALNVHK